MKPMITLVLCIFIASINFSDALQCFECLFFDGNPESDPTCQNTPKSSFLKPCDFDSSLGDLNETLATSTSGSDVESTVKTIMMCHKLTGFLDGKPAVQRKCARGPSTYNGTCVANATFLIDNRSVNDTYGCMRAEYACNAASSLLFTYVPLFAIAVHISYKLVPTKLLYS